MAKGPARILALRLMAGIGARRGEAATSDCRPARRYPMEPANPPLPTPRKRLFQSFSGSQTSKRISESAVGRSTPVDAAEGRQVMERLVDSGALQIAGSDCVPPW